MVCTMCIMAMIGWHATKCHILTTSGVIDGLAPIYQG